MLDCIGVRQKMRCLPGLRGESDDHDDHGDDHHVEDNHDDDDHVEDDHDKVEYVKIIMFKKMLCLLMNLSIR